MCINLCQSVLKVSIWRDQCHHFLSLSIFDLSMDDETIPPQFVGYILSKYFKDSFKKFWKYKKCQNLREFGVGLGLSSVNIPELQLKQQQSPVNQNHAILTKSVLSAVEWRDPKCVVVVYCIVVIGLDLRDPLILSSPAIKTDMCYCKCMQNMVSIQTYLFGV